MHLVSFLWGKRSENARPIRAILGRFFQYIFLIFSVAFSFAGVVAAQNGGGTILQQIEFGVIGFLGPALTGRLIRFWLSRE